MQFIVKLDGTIQVTATDGAALDDKLVRDAIDAHLDDVMNELLVLGAEDPAINVDFGTRHVTLEVLVEAKNPVGATALASGILRTAIHAAGGHTPDWPNEDESVWSVSLLDISATAVAPPELADA